jgi:hypothetical protein
MNYDVVGFEVFTAAIMKDAFFWDVALCADVPRFISNPLGATSRKTAFQF